MDYVVHGLTKIRHKWTNFTYTLTWWFTEIHPFRLKTIIAEQHLWSCFSFLFFFFGTLVHLLSRLPAFQLKQLSILQHLFSSIHFWAVISWIWVQQQWENKLLIIDPRCFLHALSEEKRLWHHWSKNMLSFFWVLHP